MAGARLQWQELHTLLPGVSERAGFRSSSRVVSREVAKAIQKLRAELAETRVEVAAAKEAENRPAAQQRPEPRRRKPARAPPQKKWLTLHGSSARVPLFMRGVGRVQYTAMDAASAVTLVGTFWQAKARSDSRPRARPVHATQFLHSWVRCAHPISLVRLGCRFITRVSVRSCQLLTNHGEFALKIAYNLMDAVERYHSSEPMLALFSHIIHNELCEDVYHQLQMMLEGLVEACEEKERSLQQGDFFQPLSFSLHRGALLDVLHMYHGTKGKQYAEQRALQTVRSVLQS